MMCKEVKKQAMLGVNVDLNTQRKVLMLAERSGMNVSQYLRQLTYEAIRKRSYYKVVRIDRTEGKAQPEQPEVEKYLFEQDEN